MQTVWSLLALDRQLLWSARSYRGLYEREESVDTFRVGQCKSYQSLFCRILQFGFNAPKAWGKQDRNLVPLDFYQALKP